MTARPSPVFPTGADRDALLRRFDVLAVSDPPKAAWLLTLACPPYRVFIGDQGGWYAGRAFTAQEMADAQARLKPWEFAGSGETLAAATGAGMRDLLTAGERS